MQQLAGGQHPAQAALDEVQHGRGPARCSRPEQDWYCEACRADGQEAEHGTQER